MSDAEKYTKAIQEEIQGVAERNLQIEQLTALNAAAMATIADLMSRHPLLPRMPAPKEEMKTTVTVRKYKINPEPSEEVKALLTDKGRKQKGDPLLKNYPLVIGEIITDIDYKDEWIKPRDEGDGYLFNHTLQILAATYLSPAAFTDRTDKPVIVCRGFIKPDQEDRKVDSEYSAFFKPQHFLEEYVARLLVPPPQLIKNDDIMELLGKNRSSGFYSLDYSSEPSTLLWLVIAVDDAYLIINLSLTYVGDFVSVYIKDGTEITLDFMNRCMDSFKEQLSKTAMEAMTYFN